MTFNFLEESSLLNEVAIAPNPEELNELLKAAWHHGNLAGDLAAYSNGQIQRQNPFMTEHERQVYYGHAAEIISTI
jgi:hypothetical protein